MNSRITQMGYYQNNINKFDDTLRNHADFNIHSGQEQKMGNE